MGQPPPILLLVKIKPVATRIEGGLQMLRDRPWLPESAIEFIEVYLKPWHLTFEFGSGASTLWLWERCAQVVSVEHDPAHFLPGVIMHPRPYAPVISEYPDETFDFILVDGRDRVQCIKCALPKLKRGGWLMLDNSERRRYAAAGITWLCHFYQPTPDRFGFTYPNWRASVYRK